MCDLNFLNIFFCSSVSIANSNVFNFFIYWVFVMIYLKIIFSIFTTSITKAIFTVESLFPAQLWSHDQNLHEQKSTRDGRTGMRTKHDCNDLYQYCIAAIALCVLLEGMGIYMYPNRFTLLVNVSHDKSWDSYSATANHRMRSLWKGQRLPHSCRLFF